VRCNPSQPDGATHCCRKTSLAAPRFRGPIAEEGDHDQLIRLSGAIYRRLFERQALKLTKGMI